MTEGPQDPWPALQREEGNRDGRLATGRLPQESIFRSASALPWPFYPTNLRPKTVRGLFYRGMW